MKTHLRLSWELGETEVENVEEALFLLLRAIRDAGSLRSAAAEVGVSYRYAWGLLEKWKERLGHPLAWLRQGRGARLTALGEKLLWADQRVKARLGPELDSVASEIATELAMAVSADGAPPLRIFASHGLALGILRELMNSGSGVRLDLQYRGSIDSLRLLSEGKCELAGFHIPGGELGRTLSSRYRPWLNAEATMLIKVVTRRQGFMVAPGNPKGIRGVADLILPGVRFINRQPASGTRLLFDLLLGVNGIDSSAVDGYASEEFTHLAVAAMVASSAADVGFGIEAAAAQFRLSFIPVTWETYFFALPRRSLNDPRVMQLLALMRGERFRSRVRELPGYADDRSGELAAIDDVLPRHGGAGKAVIREC